MIINFYDSSGGAIIRGGATIQENTVCRDNLSLDKELLIDNPSKSQFIRLHLSDRGSWKYLSRYTNLPKVFPHKITLVVNVPL